MLAAGTDHDDSSLPIDRLQTGKFSLVRVDPATTLLLASLLWATMLARSCHGRVPCEYISQSPSAGYPPLTWPAKRRFPAKYLAGLKNDDVYCRPRFPKSKSSTGLMLNWKAQAAGPQSQAVT